MKMRKSLLGKTWAELPEKADKELIDLIYFDQSGFNLWAKVVYAWQRRGESIVIPVSKGKSNNVPGNMLASVSEV